MSLCWCFTRRNNHCMPHFHQCVEVAQVWEGAMQAVVDGRQFVIGAGQMAVVSSYALHCFATPERSLVTVAVIPLDSIPAIQARLKQMSFCHCLLTEPPDLAVSLLRMMDGCPDLGSRETVTGLSQALLGVLMDAVGLVPATSSPTGDAMRSMIAYMQTHFTQSLTLGDLAEHFSYSCSRVSHLFQSELCTSFTAYLNQLRCRMAVSLLREGTLSVTDIAGAVGYNTLRSFYRAFGAIYHMPPLAYARLLEQEPDTP